MPPGELFARHGAKLYLDQVLPKKQLLEAHVGLEAAKRGADLRRRAALMSCRGATSRGTLLEPGGSANGGED
jgi:hypothetical protein